MSMNCPVVPAKSMRAFSFYRHGVLLSMVLRSRGISVPLWSEVKWKKDRGWIGSWDRGFSGMVFFVLRCHTVGSTYLLGTLLYLSLVTENYWS